MERERCIITMSLCLPKNDMFHWCLTFLLYAKKSFDFYHNQGLERCVSPCTLAPKVWEVDGSYLPFASWSSLKSGFQVHTATPVNLRPDFDVRKLWAAKIKMEENFLELSFILIFFYSSSKFHCCGFVQSCEKISHCNYKSAGCCWCFGSEIPLGPTVEKLPPLFIFHRPNNTTSRHEDCNHPSFGIGICQRAHQGERRIILMK